MVAVNMAYMKNKSIIAFIVSEISAIVHLLALRMKSCHLLKLHILTTI